MMKENEPAQQILTLVGQRAILRSKDLDAFGIPREYLRRLLDRGFLQRVGRGLYVSAEAEGSEHQRPSAIRTAYCQNH